MVNIVKHVFAEQRVEALRRIGKGAMKAARFPTTPFNFSNWNQKLAEKVRPVFALTVDEGAKDAFGRLGLTDQAKLWNVANPKVRDAVNQATMKFSEETNATTSMQLNDAISKLRQELADGIMGPENTPRELTARVNAVFDQAERMRAERIALTESSRAVHMGQIMAAKETGGMVKGFRWLLSTDACEDCQEVAREHAEGVEIGQSFAKTDYGPVDAPPLHPYCMCTITEIIDENWEPPEEQFDRLEDDRLFAASGGPVTAPGGIDPGGPGKGPFKWTNADNIQDARAQLKALDVNRVSFDPTWKDKETQLAMLNNLGREVTRLHNEFPETAKAMKRLAMKKGKVKSITMHNTDTIEIHGNPNNYGCYNPRGGGIDVAARGRVLEAKLKLGDDVWLADDSVLGVVRHELGHHVSDTWTMKEINLFHDAMEKVAFKGVSEYAATSPLEYMAEAFSAYTHPAYGSAARRLPKEVEAVLDKIVRGAK